MAAVGRRELVVRPQRGDRADDRRLGAVREMRVPADHARVLLERALHPLLELADPQHLREHPDQPVFERPFSDTEAPSSARCAHAELLSWSEVWAAGRLVGAVEDHLDREVAQLLGEHLDAPWAVVAGSRHTSTYPAIGNSPSPGSLRRLITSSSRSSTSSYGPSQSSTHDRNRSGMRRRSSGSSRSLPRCQVSIAMPPFGASAPSTTCERGVDAVHVHVERHELVDDLRVGVPGRVRAELAEALGDARQLALGAGDVADLDVVSRQLARRSEQQLRASRRRPAGARRPRRGTSPSGTRARAGRSPLSSKTCFTSRSVRVSSTCSRSACQSPSP